MTKQAIHTDKAPAAIGPYSQAVKAGNMLFVSGQLGINPASGEMPKSAVEQAKQALENVKAIVTEAGFDMSEVVQVHVFLTDMGDFVSLNEVYKTFFSEPYPSRAAIQAARLPKDGKVEILATAMKA